MFNDETSSTEGDVGGNGEKKNDRSEDNNTTHARAQIGLMLELLGVSFTSLFQCSLGEASLLALAGKFDSS